MGKKHIVLVTGGQRSGKSGYAQKLALSLTANPVYLATSRVWDEEFRERVLRHQADAAAGGNLLEVAHNAGVEIHHACDGSCACTTCHVVIREGFDSLNEASDQEEDMLDKAWGLEMDSRLSCQCVVGDEDLVVEIPKYNINHANEAAH